MRTILALLAALMLIPATALAEAPADLPSGVPPAALKGEPELSAPAAWPAGEGFPRTSGTGRMQDGALLWSDFLYDDKGAKIGQEQLPVGMQTEFPTAYLAFPAGGYTYAAANALRNGADIFRTGITADDAASYWRVDWVTLKDPKVPLAIFALDRDGDAATGVSEWPASANASSPGIDSALVVSSQHVVLHDLVAGTSRDLGAPAVDLEARSFVARVPRADLDPTGSWTVRVAAGVANAAGTAVTKPREAYDPNSAWLYNAGFRRHDQEGGQFDFWMETAQAEALRTGDLSDFATTVDWSRVAARETTPEPQPTGYTNRWYVSSIELGQGVLQEAYGVGNTRPNWLGRVQPYSVYVPTTYDPAKPAPLTWTLHSLGVNHNQYGAVAPDFLQDACEARGSICVGTLGRAGDMWYFDEAELDFWEVWNRVASTYALDPEATVLTGYSMGGFGTYKFGLAYPDLFAKAGVLAGPMTCGLRVYGQFAGSSGPAGSPCAESSDTGPLVGNATWLPFHIAHGGADQLVPIAGVLEHVEKIKAAGDRYVFDFFPAEDHMVWGVQDGYSTLSTNLGEPARTTDPGRFSYAFYGHQARPDLGFGPDGAYWVDGLSAHDASPGTLARVEADSAARPDDPHTVVADLPSPLAPLDATPGVRTGQHWAAAGSAPARDERLELTLDNVKTLTADLERAGFRFDRDGTVATSSAQATELTLAGAPAGTPVELDGAPAGTVDQAGRVTVAVPAGDHAVTLVIRTPTALAYTGTTAAKGDLVTLAAKLTDASGAAVAGRAVTFTTSGGRTFTAVTDAAGTARTLATLPDHGREQTVTARFDGAGRLLGSQATGVIRWGS